MAGLRLRWRPERQQRPADADPAADHPRHPPGLPRGRRRPDRDQHLQLAPRVSQADYKLEHLVPELNREGGQARARLLRRIEAREPGQAALRDRHPRANHPHRVDESGRERSGLPQHHLRRTGRDLREAARGLIEGGSDALMVETVFDTLNAKAALYAIEDLFEELGERLPVMISGTITDRSGRTLVRPDRRGVLVLAAAFAGRCRSGSIARSAPRTCAARRHAGAGRRHPRQLPSQCRPAQCLRRLRRRPGRDGGDARRIRPRRPAQPGRRLLRHDAGAHPRHRRCGRRRDAARILPQLARHTRLSGLEPFVITPESNFVNVGERTNVTGSAQFKKLILEDRYDEALAVARQQVENGAQVIDVNMDEGMLDAEAAMSRFLQPDRRRAGHRPGAGDDRFLEVERDRSRPEVRAGQGDRQLDLDEGRRSRPSCSQARQGAPLRRRGRGDGLRRTGPGRHLRAQGRDLFARLRAADGAGRFRARGHHLRPEHLRHRHRHRGAQQLRRRLHRGQRASSSGASR